GNPIVAASYSMKVLLKQIERVAAMEVPVLIEGESGTGKELVAQALHQLSSKRAGPFVPINVNAIPTTLFESELFGHQRGSFTGATNPRLGLLEAANGGAVFLDEIGDLDLTLQVKLLRVLETGEIRRVGDNLSSRIDIRFIAATNKSLLSE